MRIHTTHTRDAALRELRRANRWLVAGSVVLTECSPRRPHTRSRARRPKRSRCAECRDLVHTGAAPPRRPPAHCSRLSKLHGRANPQPLRKPLRLHRKAHHLHRNRPLPPNRRQRKNRRRRRNRRQRANRRRLANRHRPKNRLQWCRAAPEMLAGVALPELGPSVVLRVIYAAAIEP